MKTKAKVRLTVEIELSSEWSASCSVEQVFKQASDEAISEVKHANRAFTIIGTPEVVAMTNRQEYGDRKEPAK